jgi:hypothetical protein
MKNKINETTRSKGSGRYEIPLVLSSEEWKESTLQPFVNQVSKYTNQDNAYDSYDGNMSKPKSKISKDERFSKKVKKAISNLSKRKNEQGDEIHGYHPEIVKKYAKTMKKENVEKQDILKEDLAVWFGTKKKPKGSKQPKGPWVNICRKDKNGKHPPCGRPEAKDSAYPKCRAAGVAGKMSDSEKKSACTQKRRAEKSNPKPGTGNKPKMVSYKPKNESLKDVIKKVLRESI